MSIQFGHCTRIDSSTDFDFAISDCPQVTRPSVPGSWAQTSRNGPFDMINRPCSLAWTISSVSILAGSSVDD